MTILDQNPLLFRFGPKSVTFWRDIIITCAGELGNTVNNLVIMSEHNTWVIMALWRPREVKNSENEQKWPFWTKIRYFSVTQWPRENQKSQFDPNTAPKGISTNSDPKLVAQTAFQRPREVQNSQNQWKWAKMTIFPARPLLFRGHCAARNIEFRKWTPKAPRRYPSTTLIRN